MTVLFPIWSVLVKGCRRYVGLSSGSFSPIVQHSHDTEGQKDLFVCTPHLQIVKFVATV